MIPNDHPILQQWRNAFYRSDELEAASHSLDYHDTYGGWILFDDLQLADTESRSVTGKMRQ